MGNDKTYNDEDGSNEHGILTSEYHEPNTNKTICANGKPPDKEH